MTIEQLTDSTKNAIDADVSTDLTIDADSNIESLTIDFENVSSIL